MIWQLSIDRACVLDISDNDDSYSCCNWFVYDHSYHKHLHGHRAQQYDSPWSLWASVFANRAIACREGTPEDLLKAMRLYGAFATLNVRFSNDKLLSMGMPKPPRFTDYIERHDRHFYREFFVVSPIWIYQNQYFCQTHWFYYFRICFVENCRDF